ncbi:MAG: calcium-binding protein, partial [Gammaproteobacteria bacterium]|nr:calcium-binding protein [Gammaproteobacteria bacterium]
DLSATELLNIAAIDGGASHDAITGSDGNDTIIGGTGNDTLNGGAGDDTFVVEGTDQGSDRIIGGEGFDTIQGGDGDDSIGLSNLLASYSLDRIDGGLGDNTVVGTSSGNTLDLSVTELLNIAAIDGGAGNDAITGSDGNDTIIGGTGNDTLNGGAGSDDYRFSKLDGMDKINNFDAALDDIDVLAFDDIVNDGLWFTQNGNNLVIDVIGTDDRVTINNWYLGEGYQLDEIKVGSHMLQNDQVAQLVNAMAIFDIPTGVGAVVPQDVKDQLAPVIASSWQ